MRILFVFRFSDFFPDRTVRLLTAVIAATALPMVACTTSRATKAATATPTPAPAPATRVAGTYVASLALTGRSTYAGTLEITPVTGDSVRGTLTLTSPVRVDAPVAGSVRGDSLHLNGPYTAGNGCSGTVSLAISLAAMPHIGPARLVDKCVGELPATFMARR
jgi:hypothetical protein